MLRPFLACMLALVLLSGCMAAKPPAPTTPTQSAATTQAHAAGAPATSTPTSSAPAGGAASADAQAANATAPPPETARFDGTWGAGVQVPTLGPLEANGDRPYALHLDGTETGVVVEMAWTASTPASDAMGVDVAKGGKAVATAAGAGPLHLAIAGLAAGDYVVNARPSAPGDVTGAFVLQDYTLWVTVFRGPFDAAYVAPK
ncbi:MAG: hypothetical protein QOI63_1724 [Thermoplasmata archaeon]|jgi:hypothetical protein|nr:hypothetical protein [Thermoplasmata archaeon]